MCGHCTSRATLKELRSTSYGKLYKTSRTGLAMDVSQTSVAASCSRTQVDSENIYTCRLKLRPPQRVWYIFSDLCQLELYLTVVTHLCEKRLKSNLKLIIRKGSLVYSCGEQLKYALLSDVLVNGDYSLYSPLVLSGVYIKVLLTFFSFLFGKRLVKCFGICESDFYVSSEVF